MPDQAFHLSAVLQVLENGIYLGESLFFPETSRTDDNPSSLVRSLVNNVRYLIRHQPQAELFRRRGPREIQADHLVLDLEPPRHSALWREPVRLTLPIIRWNHGDDAHIAYVPSLGIEVVGSDPEQVAHMLPRHVRVTLARLKAMSLQGLTWLDRCQRLLIESVPVTVDLPTPRQTAVIEAEERQRQESILPEIATNLLEQPLEPAYEMEQPLQRLVEALTGRQPRCVLLVGPSGVGKTALVHELVRRREQLNLGSTPFWATSGARLVAGMSGFGMWQERCQKLWREASRLRAIIHLGSLIELIEVGKSEHQSQGLASFLRPYLSRGDLLSICECTPEQVPIIERLDPHLLRAFLPIHLEEPAGTRLETIISSFAEERHRDLPPEGLSALLRLHRRYASYSANPGRPLRFLRNLLADHPASLPILAGDVSTVFSRETGLPLFLLEDTVRLDLDEARQWFQARVIGQREAVDLVIDLLATVKAVMNRPRKPIASLLFIGPTGVGKTEMAKALAEYLFSSRERLTRFDMSEYNDPLAVQRLIGGLGTTEGLLTARVREQPFSVILLDEIEKAHPQLFDLLLQVLGEGRLTDAAGRVADFCNSVVIMTSNLGAESYLQGEFGFLPTGPSRQNAREHFVRAVQAAVRPELFNRIDRIVPFAPLDEDTIRLIARRQLDLLRARDGIRYRGVTLEMNDELTAHLARKGHDPRYGARPLKRALERELLAPLALEMNEYSPDASLRVTVQLEQATIKVDVRGRTDESGRLVSASGISSDDATAATNCTELRRHLQRLSLCPPARQLANDIYRLERMERRKRDHYNPELAALKQLHETLHNQLAAAIKLEDEALITLYLQQPGSGNALVHLPEIVKQAQAEADEVTLAVFLRKFTNSDRITMTIFSEDSDSLFQLGAAYYSVIQSLEGSAEVWQFLPPAAGRDEKAGPERRQLVRAADAFEPDRKILVKNWDPERKVLESGAQTVLPRKGVIGLGLEIKVRGAYPRFTGEDGLHLITTTKQTTRCLVQTAARRMAQYQPPEGIERKGFIGGQERCRTYHFDRDGIDDSRVRWFNFPNMQLTAALTEILRHRLLVQLRSMVYS